MKRDMKRDMERAVVPLWDGLLLLAQRERCPQPLAEQSFVRELAAGHVHYSPNAPEVAAFWRKLAGASCEGDPQILFPQVHWGESWIEFNIGGVRHAYPIQVVQEDEQAQPPQEVEAHADDNDQQSEGWQADRVHKKLDELEADGIVLKQKTALELRRLVEGKFDNEREKLLAQKLPPPAATPTRPVINAAIKKRLNPR
jgi:hypothetical protein